jgi:hypothetical protein
MVIFRLVLNAFSGQEKLKKKFQRDFYTSVNMQLKRN